MTEGSNTPGGGTYYCSKCGQLKKGHTCPVVATKAIGENMPLPTMVFPTNSMTTRRAYQQNIQQIQNQQTHMQQQQQMMQQQQQQQIMQQQQQQMLQQQVQMQMQEQTQMLQQQQAQLQQHAQQPILMGPLPTGPLTAEQKRAREKNASDFNMWFLLERQERYPYYFDPHTKTIQVIGSWYINVSDAWNTMTPLEKKQFSNYSQGLANHKNMYLQKQHDIQNLQAQIAKLQQAMLFCDVCDKGYHTFCLNPPMDSAPTGGWRCNNCVFCVHCGTRTPGPSGKWKGSYTSCETCAQLINDRRYCTVCRKVIKPNEKGPTIQCGYCERWTHAKCDNISEAMLDKFKENPHYPHKCPTCRGGHQKTTPKPLITSEDDDEDDDEEEKPAETPNKRRGAAAQAGRRRKAKKARHTSSDDDEEEDHEDGNDRNDVNVED
ncbi:hypothetical protein SAMD00019534_075060, partial [Acytostelium subglobosum LB1]|uniref:hypothetical protein n=1 Tax=Acytostelium subglobosum LB1 TaxID=1410327 RepID=UPI0006449E61